MGNDEAGAHIFNTIKEAEKEVKYLKEKDRIIKVVP